MGQGADVREVHEEQVGLADRLAQQAIGRRRWLIALLPRRLDREYPGAQPQVGDDGEQAACIVRDPVAEESRGQVGADGAIPGPEETACPHRVRGIRNPRSREPARHGAGSEPEVVNVARVAAGGTGLGERAPHRVREGSAARPPSGDEGRRRGHEIDRILRARAARRERRNRLSFPFRVPLEIHQQIRVEERRQRSRGFEPLEAAVECESRRRMDDRERRRFEEQTRRGRAEMGQADERAAAVAQGLARELTAGRWQRLRPELPVNAAEPSLVESADAIGARREDRGSAIRQRAARDEPIAGVTEAQAQRAERWTLDGDRPARPAAGARMPARPRHVHGKTPDGHAPDLTWVRDPAPNARPLSVLSER